MENHHFPMLFPWFSYSFPMFLRGPENWAAAGRLSHCGAGCVGNLTQAMGGTLGRWRAVGIPWDTLWKVKMTMEKPWGNASSSLEKEGI